MQKERDQERDQLGTDVAENDAAETDPELQHLAAAYGYKLLISGCLRTSAYFRVYNCRAQMQRSSMDLRQRSLAVIWGLMMTYCFDNAAFRTQHTPRVQLLTCGLACYCLHAKRILHAFMTLACRYLSYTLCIPKLNPKHMPMNSCDLLLAKTGPACDSPQALKPTCISSAVGYLPLGVMQSGTGNSGIWTSDQGTAPAHMTKCTC